MSADPRILEVHEDVKRELSANPDVRSVGIGLKEVNGELTNEIAFKVYVDRKKPLSELTPERIIPGEIRGFKTDVVRIAPKTPLTGAGPRPLVGGIACSSLILTSQNIQQEHGTLGCIARLKSSTKKVLVSNEHVFLHTQAQPGSGNEVFQPQHSDSAGFVCNRVGKTSKELTPMSPSTTASSPQVFIRIVPSRRSTTTLEPEIRSSAWECSTDPQIYQPL